MDRKWLRGFFPVMSFGGLLTPGSLFLGLSSLLWSSGEPLTRSGSNDVFSSRGAATAAGEVITGMPSHRYWGFQGAPASFDLRETIFSEEEASACLVCTDLLFSEFASVDLWSRAIIGQQIAQVAWKLHAKELTRDLGTLSSADKRIQPLLRLVYRSRADYVWELLDDPNSSTWAWWISLFLKLLVTFSVLISNFEAVKPPLLEETLTVILQTSFDTVFLAEFLCRILSAPSKRSYLMDPLNWADMLSALGLPLRAGIGFGIDGLVPNTGTETVHVGLLYFLPLARLLKLLRYFDSFRLLIDACINSAEALPVLSYMLVVMVLFSATIVYLVESRDNVPTLQHSLWLAIVTVTTVGYGDYYPESPWGYLCVSVLTFISVLFLAMPVGIVGHEFTQSWLTRRKVLLQTRVRRCLNKWGYTAADLQSLGRLNSCRRGVWGQKALSES